MPGPASTSICWCEKLDSPVARARSHCHDEKCEFEITRKIAADNAEWTPERIASRQQWLANQATAVWRLSEIE